MLAGIATVSTLDRYHLVEVIGRGGMAEVFRARVQSLGGFERDVAVKVLLPQYASEPEFVDMLLDEARIAGAIVHPCVVQMLDVGRHQEIFYLVMEYVCGTDLRTLARGIEGGRLPLGLSLYAMSEVLRGLGAVHAAVDERGKPRRIIHRDVSPANVLLDDAGAVKLGDFGIAHASGRLTRTRVGSIKGKSRYMAPEQLTGKPVDHRADLYAVGVTLFEALLGDVARDSSLATPLGPVFAWPRRLPPNALPSDVTALLKSAITDEPGQRFQDAASFRRAVVESLRRHAPGYDGESLARELKRLRGETVDDFGEMTQLPTEVLATRPRLALVGSQPIGVASPLLPASPSAPTPTPTPSLTQTRPLPSLPPTRPAPPLPRGLRYSEPARPYGRSDGAGLFEEGRPTEPCRTPPEWRRPTGTQLLVAASAMVTTVIIAVGVALTTGRSPPPPSPPRPIATPVVATPPPPLPLPPPTTGTLTVAGPAGARVSIGSVAYPPAPCSLELPAGEYDVRLRFRRRAVNRHVIVAPGQVSQL
jgi:serine/threonine protein kinase